MRKKNSVRILWILAFSLFLGGTIFCAAPVRASVKRVTAAKKYKKAPSLKTGTNRVTVKAEDSYVRYTVPKKGTYKITFSNLKGLDEATRDKIRAGFTSYYYYKSDKKLHYKKGRYNNKKDSGFVFATDWLVENDENYQKGWTSSCTVTYSLKKGRKLYFMFYGTPKNRFSVEVKIRRRS